MFRFRLAMKRVKSNVQVEIIVPFMASHWIQLVLAIRIFCALPIGHKQSHFTRLAAKVLAKDNVHLASIRLYSIIFRTVNLLRWPVATKPFNYLPKMAYDWECWVKCMNHGFGPPPFIRTVCQWLVFSPIN